MPRRAKKKSEQTEATSQAAPPPESEEDRLIRVGSGMKIAWEKHGPAITKKHVDAVIESGFPPHEDLVTFSPNLRRCLAQLGKQDPRPLMEQLKELCQNLHVLCQNQEEKKRLVKEMYLTLSDLELILAVRRHGGRPKGTRKKEIADQIENIRKWKAGDRTWVSGSSVKDVADELKVSRQTVYTILDEIKAVEEKN